MCGKFLTIRHGIFCLGLLLAALGCSPQEATDSLKSANESAKAAGEKVAAGASELAKQGEALAQSLSAEATAFLQPLQAQFSSLERLKQTPAELKTAVTKLVDAIESQATKLQLPEKLKQGLTLIKDKLIALRDYLAGEVEQAKVEEHLRGIMDSVKSELGAK